MFAIMMFSTAASAIIVLAALLLEHALRSRGYPARWLWLGSLVAAMLTTVSPFMVASWAGPQAATSTLVAKRESQVAYDNDNARVPAFQPQIDPSLALAGNDGFSVNLILLAAWLAASGASAIVLAMSAWRIAQMRRTWRPAVIAGVPVLVSHDVGPAIVGLIHHGVVMPAWVESLSAAEQRLVLRHEREHVRAGDPLLLWGATSLCIVLPWNAAMWYALKRLRHAIEMDCDARVLASQPDAHAYCTLLLDVGERTLAGVAPMAALAEPSTLLERRVNAMTSKPRGAGRTIAAAGAGIALIAIACVAPRTRLAPRDHAVALVRELNGLLRDDSLAIKIPREDRDRLVSSLTDSGAPYDGVALRTGQQWERILDPQIDDVIQQQYPSLYTRSDTVKQLVILTYDAQGRLKRHALRPMPSATAIASPNSEFSVLDDGTVETFTSLGEYQWTGHRERPRLNTAILVRAERGAASRGTQRNTDTERLLGRLAAESNDNKSEEFGRRADSLARAIYPEAYANHTDASVVFVLFSHDARILRSDARKFPLAQVFDVVDSGSGESKIFARSSDYLLAQMKLDGIPQLRSSGSQIMHEAPRTVIIYGVELKK